MPVLLPKFTKKPTRTLSVRSPAIPEHLGDPVLQALRLEGDEGHNRLFEYHLYLRTLADYRAVDHGTADWDLKSFIDQPVSCRIAIDGYSPAYPDYPGHATTRDAQGMREINGIVTAAELWGDEGDQAQYRLTLRPSLFRATLSADCRIFQKMDVQEILRAVLESHHQQTVWGQTYQMPLREYVTQYNETDFAFFERLCQEWGLSYYFSHSDGRDILRLDGTPYGMPKVEGPYDTVRFHAPGWKADAEYFHRVNIGQRIVTRSFSMDDYDYSTSRALLGVTENGYTPDRPTRGAIYAWHGGSSPGNYVWPGAGGPLARNGVAPKPTYTETVDRGRTMASIRLEVEQTEARRMTASGNLRGMVPGRRFRLAGHPAKTANTDYLVVDTHFLIEEVPQETSRVGSAVQHWRVQVELTALPGGERLRPPATRNKPLTHGPQSAVVTGPAGQPVWTDSFGRILVRFHWDHATRDRSQGDNSCWIRVAASWAGADMGALSVPRIGHEVLVDFIGGDPDMPVCVQSLYNDYKTTPWMLPREHALSGIRSRELIYGPGASQRGNHLVFDDTQAKIQTQLKSDHLHSQLSLGHVRRIEDPEGRKDARGEGFDLRTDGSGALRAARGLLISTDERSKAAGTMLGRSEMVALLESALVIARQLAQGAATALGAERDTSTQAALSNAVEALGRSGAGEIASGAEEELKLRRNLEAAGQPVIAISGAAGIASATPRDHLQYAGINIDTVAGHNQQHYAGESIISTAGEDIDSVSLRGDIRCIANAGKIIAQAQHNSIEITAAKSLVLTSSEDEVVIRGKKSITLVLEDGTYLRLAGGQMTAGMSGSFTVRSSGLNLTGPSTLLTDFPSFNLANQASRIQFHYGVDKPQTLPEKAFAIVKAAGAVNRGKSDGEALAETPVGKALNIGI
jgi:type VI secretion system secreted protein VgrG